MSMPVPEQESQTVVEAESARAASPGEPGMMQPPQQAFMPDGGLALPRRRASVGRLAWLVAAGIGFVVIAVSTLVFLMASSDEADAIDACEEAVLDQLKAPATAEFGEATTEAFEDGSYTVTGQVDAQNGFGALIRSDYLCAAIPVGNDWVAIAVLI